ncbi:kinase phosphorylation protein-domain-containing protein [Pisolithus orientalis]|uniref:kinase phosphorylation protein-domain-containing protein n=1 Tax=Pisolithus orientalis TaxID=936130 RepID=UPI002225240F|nr:kinase phosphorylation protein-domain-containing protein [Pisolithus orientalis]KAI6033234.1 kinase phosphorylation protein-domain-containing protein [Pisolithus orientalis]
MFEPVRGGTRGGQAQFKWSDVAADKDREHYLGHSINAPTGRWQKNKDIHWYGREESQTQAERDEEIRKVKEAEAEALAVALYVLPPDSLPGRYSHSTAGFLRRRIVNLWPPQRVFQT